MTTPLRLSENIGDALSGLSPSEIKARTKNLCEPYVGHSTEMSNGNTGMCHTFRDPVSETRTNTNQRSQAAREV